jgi:hypothetical protein
LARNDLAPARATWGGSKTTRGKEITGKVEHPKVHDRIGLHVECRPIRELDRGNDADVEIQRVRMVLVEPKHAAAATHVEHALIVHLHRSFV